MMLDRRLLEFKELVRSRTFGKQGGIARDVSGIDFFGLKEFEPGDSPSDINRAASQVHGELLVTQRMPDRELVLVFVLDTTASMLHGSKEAYVVALLEVGHQMAQEIRARVFLAFPAYMAAKKERAIIRVPRVITGDTKQYFASHFQDVAKDVAAPSPDIAATFTAISKEFGSRTVFTIVASDFLFDADYGKAFGALRRRGQNPAIAFALLDSAEIALPNISFGALRIRDSETGKSLLIARPPDHYLDAHKALWSTHRAAFEVVPLMEV